jgi:iron complex outermembrane receptor protein
MSHVGRSMQVIIGLVLVAEFIVSSAGWAQSGKGNKPSAVETEIEEITVTAQKREESLQEIPISVTALTGAVLVQKGVASVLDLGETVPNVAISTNPASTASTTISMRGLTQADPNATLQPSVGLYVDGAYIAKIFGSNLDLEDLERVEVLRGPQGTLYGRNTIGGAVNFITNKPTEERSITVKTEAGNYDTFRERTTFNLPLIGKNGFLQSAALGTLSLRETVGYKTHDGFYQVQGSGNADLTNQNRVYNMTLLRWQPTGDFTVDYSFEYHRYRQAPSAQQVTYIYPGSPVDGGPFDLHPFIRTNRVDTVFANAILMRDLNSLHRQVDDGNHRMNILTGTWNLGEMGPLGNITLKSISSYRSFVYQADQDLDGSTLHLAEVGQSSDVQHWSEELQWIGVAPRFHYVLGAYYYGEYTMHNQDQVFFGSATNLPYKNLIKTQSYAPYGQVTWTPPVLGDKLSLTAGIRYTQEQVHTDRFYRCAAIITTSGVNLCNQGIFGLQDFNASAGKAFGGIHGSGTPGVSPMGDIAYQLTNDSMLYGRVSRGFKGGGFNGTATDPISFSNYFRPERLLTYEAGIKSEWLDKRVRINVDGFFSDYRDFQATVFRASPEHGTLTLVSNAGKAEIWGMEFEGVAMPLRGLEASVNYSFLAPKYTEWWDQKFDANNNPVFDQHNQPVLENVKNQRTFSFAPRNQLSVGLTYTAPPTTAGTFSAHVDTYWQDAIYYISTYTTLGSQADRGWAYAVVNGRLQLAGIPLTKGTLDLAVVGRNLLDRKYRVYGIDFGPSLGFATNQYGDPRTFGLALTYNFTAG